MNEATLKLLRKPEIDQEHTALLEHCKALVKRSRCKMSERYSDWDNQDLVYRGIRCLDKDDVKAAREGKPVKMVVPNTFAQVQTFVSFLFLLFTQNRTYFELVANGTEDHGNKQKDIEAVIEYDLKMSKWVGILYQLLLDTARFGLSVTECSWSRKVVRAYVEQPVVTNFNGLVNPVLPGSEWQDFVKFEGNQVKSVSPYRFFPDTNFPITEFQRGEFCAVEEEFSISQLRELESVGEVAGVELIPPLPRNFAKTRGAETRTVLDFTQKSVYQNSGGQSEGTALVTKMQVRIVPSKFKIDGEKTLGPETFPVLYHIWYANDSRVIRAEPAYWWHDQFGWTVGQFTPDMHHTLNLGLADLVYRLQDVITWLYNSRITDVRRNMRGRNIVNPAMIDMKSYDSEGDIYVRSGNAGPIERAILPLNVNEVTASHVQDAQVLAQLMEVVTGVNGNAMGQYSQGRRSAEQTRVVTSGAAGRMKMHGSLIFSDALAPLAMMMTSNSRQQLSVERFNLIIGKDAVLDPTRFISFKGTPEEVIVNADYFTFDGTLQSEKGYVANALQELLATAMSNPLVAQQLDLDPRALMREIMFLRGVGSTQRFSLSQNVAAGAPPLPMPQIADPNAPIV
jgi:hypothetical protein